METMNMAPRRKTATTRMATKKMEMKTMALAMNIAVKEVAVRHRATTPIRMEARGSQARVAPSTAHNLTQTPAMTANHLQANVAVGRLHYLLVLPFGGLPVEALPQNHLQKV
jgi:hypothetical protein